MKQERTTNKHVSRAVAIAGSQTELARLCGKKQGHVWNWLHQEKLTAEVAVLLDKATCGAVPKHITRPDLFQAPQTGA